MIDALSAYVASNGLREGDPLPSERELCRQLGVSRASLREGLRAMQMLGLVDVRAGSGVFVGRSTLTAAVRQIFPRAAATRQHLLDLLEVRETLEMRAMELAAQRLRPEHAEELARTVTEQRRVVEAGGNPVAVDLRFHEILFQAAANQVLLRLYEAIAELLREGREEFYRACWDPAIALSSHAAIAEALALGQGATAVRLMRAHLKESAAAMLAILASQPPAPPANGQHQPLLTRSRHAD